MQPFTTLTGVAAPLIEDDINTDQITPVHRSLEVNYAELLFQRKRQLPDGTIQTPPTVYGLVTITKGLE